MLQNKCFPDKKKYTFFCIKNVINWWQKLDLIQNLLNGFIIWVHFQLRLKFSPIVFLGTEGDKIWSFVGWWIKFLNYIYMYFLSNILSAVRFSGLCSCKGVYTEFICNIITFQETLAVIQLSWIDGSYTFLYIMSSHWLGKETLTLGVAERCQGNQQLGGTENTRSNVCVCDKHFSPERKGCIVQIWLNFCQKAKSRTVKETVNQM